MNIVLHFSYAQPDYYPFSGARHCLSNILSSAHRIWIPSYNSACTSSYEETCLQRLWNETACTLYCVELRMLSEAHMYGFISYLNTLSDILGIAEGILVCEV